MAKRDKSRHPYYSNLVQCYAHGLVNEVQYNLLTKAMEDDGFEVKYEGSPTKTGHHIKWTVTISKTV